MMNHFKSVITEDKFTTYIRVVDTSLPAVSVSGSEYKFNKHLVKRISKGSSKRKG